VILDCTVLTQYSSVTDRQTEGRTDEQTPRSGQARLRSAKHSAIARKNLLIFLRVTIDNVRDFLSVFFVYFKVSLYFA